MKKAPFIILLVLTFIAEALACFLIVNGIKDIKTDPVKVNECMHSVSENYGDASKYNTQLDYAVIDNDGRLVYKTRDGLAESVNDAIKTRGLILDLEVDGEVIGKVIFDYSMDEQLNGVKTKVIMLSVIVGVLQIVILVFWYIYIRKSISRRLRTLIHSPRESREAISTCLLRWIKDMSSARSPRASISCAPSLRGHVSQRKKLATTRRK